MPLQQAVIVLRLDIDEVHAGAGPAPGDVGAGAEDRHAAHHAEKGGEDLGVDFVRHLSDCNRAEVHGWRSLSVLWARGKIREVRLVQRQRRLTVRVVARHTLVRDGNAAELRREFGIVHNRRRLLTSLRTSLPLTRPGLQCDVLRHGIGGAVPSRSGGGRHGLVEEGDGKVILRAMRPTAEPT
jgi:hypothetical protein